MTPPNSRFVIRAHREPFFNDQISIRMGLICQTSEGERVSMVETLRLTDIREEDRSTDMGPTFTLRPDEAQGFMDELWRIGIRPTDGTGSTGQLAATQAHLSDMRRIALSGYDVSLPMTSEIPVPNNS